MPAAEAVDAVLGVVNVAEVLTEYTYSTDMYFLHQSNGSLPVFWLYKNVLITCQKVTQAAPMTHVVNESKLSKLRGYPYPVN